MTTEPRLTTKATNPKDAVGSNKAPMHYVSEPVIFEVGLGMLEGALKYGGHNYRVAGVRASIYYDAARRHLARWWEGEDIDPEAIAGAKLHHITKAIASLVVIRDAMLAGKLTDDRPPNLHGNWMEDMNARAAALIAAVPNPVMPYTEAPLPAPVRLSSPEEIAAAQARILSEEAEAAEAARLGAGDDGGIIPTTAFPPPVEPWELRADKAGERLDAALFVRREPRGCPSSRHDSDESHHSGEFPPPLPEYPDHAEADMGRPERPPVQHQPDTATEPLLRMTAERGGF